MEDIKSNPVFQKENRLNWEDIKMLLWLPLRCSVIFIIIVLILKLVNYGQ